MWWTEQCQERASAPKGTGKADRGSQRYAKSLQETERHSVESLQTLQLKTYYKMCRQHGNDDGCKAAMEAMELLLCKSGVLNPLDKDAGSEAETEDDE